MRELFLYDTQQGGFADAVVAYDAYLLTSADLEVDVVHKGLSGAALTHGDIHALDFKDVDGGLNCVCEAYLRIFCIMDGALYALHFLKLLSAALSHFCS